MHLIRMRSARGAVESRGAQGPLIDERADWDLAAQTLTLSVRGSEGAGASTMTLWWVEPARWHSLLAEAGFEVLECYGWFDRRPFTGGEDSVWIARRK